MASPLATATRLLTALDELVMEETMLLRMEDFVETAELRERMLPVVEQLCLCAPEFSPDSGFRRRLDDLLHRSEQNLRVLEAELARRHEELLRVGEALGRLRRVAPAYKTVRSGLESRLNTAA